MGTFKFNPDQIAPQAPVAVAESSRSGSPSTSNAPHEVSELERLLSRIAPDDPREHLQGVLKLLQLPIWVAGFWRDEPGGWLNTQTGESLSFNTARELIAARIKELGLNPHLVYDWWRSVIKDSVSYNSFLRLSFDEQMSRFR
jgi:hypothetical protein